MSEVETVDRWTLTGEPWFHGAWEARFGYDDVASVDDVRQLLAEVMQDAADVFETFIAKYGDLGEEVEDERKQLRDKHRGDW